MEEKQCFKCSRILPLEHFYVHSKMADGHLGKCKDCTKRDTEERRVKKTATDLEWVEKEVIRHRAKQDKYRKLDMAWELSPEEKRVSIQLYRKRFPEKHKAHNLVHKAIKKGELIRGCCEVCQSTEDIEAHHEDYSKPLEVRWLCDKHHKERHVELNRLERLKRFKFNPN